MKNQFHGKLKRDSVNWESVSKWMNWKPGEKLNSTKRKLMGYNTENKWVSFNKLKCALIYYGGEWSEHVY